MKKILVLLIAVIAIVCVGCGPDYTKEYNVIYADYEAMESDLSEVIGDYVSQEWNDEFESVVKVDEYGEEFVETKNMTIKFCDDATAELEGYKDGIEADDYELLLNNLSDLKAKTNNSYNDFLYKKYFAVTSQISKDITIARDSNKCDDPVEWLEGRYGDVDKLYKYVVPFEGDIIKLGESMDVSELELFYYESMLNLTEEYNYLDINNKQMEYFETWAEASKSVRVAFEEDDDNLVNIILEALEVAYEVNDDAYNLLQRVDEEKKNLSSINAEDREYLYTMVEEQIGNLVHDTYEFIDAFNGE